MWSKSKKGCTQRRSMKLVPSPQSSILTQTIAAHAHLSYENLNSLTIPMFEDLQSLYNPRFISTLKLTDLEIRKGEKFENVENLPSLSSLEVHLKSKEPEIQKLSYESTSNLMTSKFQNLIHSYTQGGDLNALFPFSPCLVTLKNVKIMLNSLLLYKHSETKLVASFCSAEFIQLSLNHCCSGIDLIAILQYGASFIFPPKISRTVKSIVALGNSIANVEFLNLCSLQTYVSAKYFADLSVFLNMREILETFRVYTKTLSTTYHVFHNVKRLFLSCNSITEWDKVKECFPNVSYIVLEENYTNIPNVCEVIQGIMNKDINEIVWTRNSCNRKWSAKDRKDFAQKNLMELLDFIVITRVSDEWVFKSYAKFDSEIERVLRPYNQTQLFFND